MTYEAVLVGDVVGKFEFVERHGFVHPMFAGGWRVGMYVHSLGHLRVRLAGDHPARVVEFVSAVIYAGDVHQQNVLRTLVEAAQRHFERRKHSPACTQVYDARALDEVGQAPV